MHSFSLLGLRARGGGSGVMQVYKNTSSYCFHWTVSQIPNIDGACRFIIYTKGMEDRIEICNSPTPGGVESESHKTVSCLLSFGFVS